MSLVDSATEGAKARLRPILMTSCAFIFGLMPLALATGVGAVGNRSIGMGAVGCMLVGTVVGYLLFLYCLSFRDYRKGCRQKRMAKNEETHHEA